MQNKSIRLSLCPTVFAVMVFALVALTGRNAAGFSETPEERHAFEELMAVKWLACNFEPVETPSGDVLESIGFDPEGNRTRIFTAPRDESVIIESFLKSDDSFFAVPMTLVFDAAKGRVQWLLPEEPSPVNEFSVTSSINVQRVGWIHPGSLHVASIMSEQSDETFILNIVILPAWTTEGAFAAMANIFISGRMVMLSARCTADISVEIRPEAERVRLELEAVGSKQ